MRVLFPSNPLEESEADGLFKDDGKPYSPNGIVPPIVNTIAARHNAPFYSVDIIQSTKGDLRLIEIGDGQVSDRKGWETSIFCQILAQNI